MEKLSSAEYRWTSTSNLGDTAFDEFQSAGPAMGGPNLKSWIQKVRVHRVVVVKDRYLRYNGKDRCAVPQW